MNQSQSTLSYKSLLFFSIPSILTSLTEVLASTIDTSIIGKLGTQPLAALAVASTIFNSFTWIFNFLINASLEAVASYRGQSDSQKLIHQTRISILLACIVGILASAVLLLGRDLWFSLAGAQGSFNSYLSEYFTTRASFQWVSILFLTLISILRGLGLVKHAFWIMFFTALINAIVSYSLVNFYELGVYGVALGTITANVFMCIVSIVLVIRAIPQLISLKWEKVWGLQFQRMGANSRDLFFRSLFLTSSFFISTKVAAQIGVEALAAHQVLLQAWLFVAYFVDGIALSGTILGAENLARSQKNECQILSKRLLNLGGFTGAFFAISYLFFRDWFIWFFTTDQQVVNLIKQVWLLIVLCQVFNAWAFIYDGLLFGLNRFSYLRTHMILGVVLIFIPFCIYTCWSNQLIALWLGMALLNIYRSITGFQEIKRLLS